MSVAAASHVATSLLAVGVFRVLCVLRDCARGWGATVLLSVTRVGTAVLMPVDVSLAFAVVCVGVAVAVAVAAVNRARWG